MLPPILEEEALEDGGVMGGVQQTEEELRMKKQQERDTCFGFDEVKDWEKLQKNYLIYFNFSG